MADTLKTSPSSLKLRVMTIREQLPADVRQLILAKFPDLDTAVGANRIHNVLSGAVGDARITEFLETLVQPAVAA